MEIKHTPGTWKQEYCGRDRIRIYKESDQRRIATVAVKTTTMDEANARLIAAAPELLEALRRLEDARKRGDLDITEWAAARAAIEKAKQ